MSVTLHLSERDARLLAAHLQKTGPIEGQFRRDQLDQIRLLIEANLPDQVAAPIVEPIDNRRDGSRW